MSHIWACPSDPFLPQTIGPYEPGWAFDPNYGFHHLGRNVDYRTSYAIHFRDNASGPGGDFMGVYEVMGGVQRKLLDIERPAYFMVFTEASHTRHQTYWDRAEITPGVGAPLDVYPWHMGSVNIAAADGHAEFCSDLIVGGGGIGLGNAIPEYWYRWDLDR